MTLRRFEAQNRQSRASWLTAIPLPISHAAPALKFAAGLGATALFIGLELSRVAHGAAPAPYTETIPNTKVAFDMVPIPAGTFTMGSPSSEAGRNDDEGPAHQVTLKAFYIGTKEVTWDEYDEFALQPGPAPQAEARA